MGFKQIVPTTEQNGSRKVEGNKEFIRAYVAASTMTLGKPYVLQNYDHGVEAIVPATLGVAHTVGIAIETNTTAGDYWFQVKGPCEAFTLGTTDITVDDFLEVLNAGVALVIDHATVRSVGSVAVAVDANATDTTPAVTSVWLIGDPVQVAAS
jgi:hypothetical protein